MTLAFAADGRLFGFSEINGGLNNGPLALNTIYEFNLDTGIPTALRPGSRSLLSSIRGAEFVEAIPEPTTGLTALIVVGLMLARRHGA
ncbi:MAG: hypothetical protein AAF333_15785 [Planctomycetota bacterium]